MQDSSDRHFRKQPVECEHLDVLNGSITRARAIPGIEIAQRNVAHVVAETVAPVKVEAAGHAAASTVTRVVPALPSIATRIADGAIADEQWVAQRCAASGR